MSGKNPTDFHNRSRSNSITHNPQKCMRNWLRKVFRHLLLLVHPPEKKRKKHVDIFGGDHRLIIFAHISYESYRRWLWAISFWKFRSISLHLAEMKIEVSLLVARRGEEEIKERRGIHRENKKHCHRRNFMSYRFKSLFKIFSHF